MPLTIAAPAPARFSRMTSNRKVSTFSVQTRKVSCICDYCAKLKGQVQAARLASLRYWLTWISVPYSAPAVIATRVVFLCASILLAGFSNSVVAQESSLSVSPSAREGSSNLDLARQLNDAFAAVVEKVSPSVVVINIMQKATP